MCQATVYLLRDGQEEEVMRDTTYLEVTKDGVRVGRFFEEPRFLPARVGYVDFLANMVGLVPIAAEEGLRFAIREGGRTVGSGVVSKIVE